MPGFPRADNRRMDPDWRAVLDALHSVALADDEEECLRRICAHAKDLFGAHRLDLVARERSGLATGCIALTADGELLGELVLPDGAVVSADAVELMTMFGEHAGLTLQRARLLADHEHQSRRDALTGLRNYREFRETLSRLLPDASAQPRGQVSLVVVDLDRFKDVNDRHGHVAGDRLLRATAAALSAVCRADDGAFRIGGDEFALVLPRTDADQAADVARRAHRAVTRLAGSLGASWGVASAPADGSTRDALMAAADSAMYKHKRNGTLPEVVTGHTSRRLAMVARLTTRLVAATDIEAIAGAAVEGLHESFGYYLAVIQRLDVDAILRVVACAGPLAAEDSNFLARAQSIDRGVNGRVARTRRVAVVPDTRADPDYLSYNLREDPGSEVSVPIMVGDRLWGVLNLEQIAAYGFDESDVHLAETVAAVTASAIHRCLTIMELTASTPLAG